MKLHSRSVFGPTFGVSATIPDFDRGATNTKLVERADVGCVLVASTIDLTTTARELGAVVALDFPLAAGATTKAPPYRALWLTPRSWLIHCPVDEERELALRINTAFPDKQIHAALFTDELCWLELSGLEASNLMTEGGFISLEPEGLPIGFVKRTRLADVAVIALRLSLHTWLLGVERSRAIFLATWFQAAARRSARINCVENIQPTAARTTTA